VSTLEDRLRAAFRADADTVSPDSVPDFAGITGIKSSPVAGRARLITPVAAAIAIVAIAAGVAGTSSLLHGRAQQPRGAPSSRGQATPRKVAIGPLATSHRLTPGAIAAGPLPVPVLGEDGQQAPRAVAASASAAGVPRFFVADEPATGPHANQLVVRDTQTGKIVGTLTPPAGKFFGSVAAAGNRTFVAAVMPTNGQPCVNQLYQFQLNASGQPGPLAALHVAVPGTFNETDTLAVSPDGSTIAYATYLCDQGRGEFGVIDLAARRVRVWSAGLTFLVGLSLSADGRLLAFAEIGGPGRILRTGAAGGSIIARSQIVSRDSYWVALAPDGAAFYGCTISPARLPIPQEGNLTYFWQAMGSTQQHVIAKWRNVNSPQCMASLDPSGPYLLVQLPTTNDYVRPVILDLRTGATTSIPAMINYAPLTVAW
jgi:hypothetical protein